MKQKLILILLASICSSFWLTNTTFAEEAGYASELGSEESTQLLVTSDLSENHRSVSFKRHSIDLLFSHGYAFIVNCCPEEILHGEQADNREREPLYFNLFNFGVELSYNYKFNKRYSLGTGLRFISNFQLSFSIVNRIMFPFAEESLYLYIDFPIGIDLFSLYKSRLTGIRFDFNTRFGFSWRFTELVGLHSNIGLEMGIHSPYPDKDYWHVFKAGVRFSLGIDFSF